MTSTILAELPLANAVHALAQLGRRPPDRAFLRAALVTAESALASFAVALESPLADLDGPARRAYLAALVLDTTLAALPEDLAALRRTVCSMLETLEPLVGRGSRPRRALAWA